MYLLIRIFYVSQGDKFASQARGNLGTFYDEECYFILQVRQNIFFIKYHLSQCKKISKKFVMYYQCLSYHYTDIKIEKKKSSQDYVTNFESDKKMLTKFMITKCNQCFKNHQSMNSKSVFDNLETVRTHRMTKSMLLVINFTFHLKMIYHLSQISFQKDISFWDNPWYSQYILSKKVP